MQHDLQPTIALLTRTPATLDALLRCLPEAWTECNEGANTWTPSEIIAHLIHGELTDWIPRARWIWQFGDTRPFEPFNRAAHLEESQRKPLPQLLDEFGHARAESLAQLRALNLQPPDLDRRGQHPALGAVTMSQLLCTWAVHDLTHLHQISRVMAHQYRNDVGPWSAYLGVLSCDGHSK